MVGSLSSSVLGPHGFLTFRPLSPTPFFPRLAPPGLADSPRGLSSNLVYSFYKFWAVISGQKLAEGFVS